MNGVDELFEVRNNFYIGNYQSVVNEALVLSPASEEQTLERDILLHRAYVAQEDYDTVFDEVEDNAPPPLIAVRTLATYLSDENNSKKVLDTVKTWPQLPPFANDDNVRLISGIIYSLAGDYEAALRAMHESKSLECRVFIIQLYLLINRVEHALKELSNVQKMDDMSTLTQLAQAWVDLFINDQAKIEEAFVIFTELVQKWSPTPLLLNGLAVCHLHRIHEEREGKLAEKELLSSLEKDNKNPDTLANLIAVQLHVGKSTDFVQRYVKRLNSNSASHPWVKELSEFSDSFDNNSARYTPSKPSK
eukprot:TRINITY_DN1210_c0_g1_i1.p1 TRINITY_DN1210_c0_g1~~TRINITY_DN1210_c0_g1_i1.p1  ORF type:complete len:305 (-),score=47.46 TRINITY_DN1210_c0_g1_i1:602-1516(-)